MTDRLREFKTVISAMTLGIEIRYICKNSGSSKRICLQDYWSSKQIYQQGLKMSSKCIYLQGLKEFKTDISAGTLGVQNGYLCKDSRSLKWIYPQRF